ncbi:hypothetical protein [Dickeya sp. MK7]|uniref:hypothetical protein n=1 Tax=Dickeya sp. MK7 TaxID=1224145 RepID=UPI001268C4FF|nr:hypothetical protein [Dickeya sp. MK7]
MSKYLPIVDQFSTRFEIWKQRDATLEELIQFYHKNKFFPSNKVNEKLINYADNMHDAARLVIAGSVSNDLENHIEDNLANSNEYKKWRELMPSKTPKPLAFYQKKYSLDMNFDDVDKEIISCGKLLTQKQQLVHGGNFFNGKPIGTILKTERPLSTSLCPLVAQSNALWRGKAYDENALTLIVLNVICPQTKVFVFRHSGTNLGHEKEVLFASGAILTLRGRTEMGGYTNVSKFSDNTYYEKAVPRYVLKVDIS